MIDKQRMINIVYKILTIYERESFENYCHYCANTAMLLAGYIDDNNEKWLTNYVAQIRGLYFFGNSLTHDEVKTVVLNITNGISRNYH